MSPAFPKRNGRSGEIRTPDPLLPKQVRYQAALRSARPYVRRDNAVEPPEDSFRRGRVIAAGAVAGKRGLPVQDCPQNAFRV